MNRRDFLLLTASTAMARAATLASSERQRNLDSFDQVWTTVRDKHWDPLLGGVDWNAARSQLRPRMERAATMAEARAVLAELLDRLHLSHFEILPSSAYADIGDERPGGSAVTGIDVREIRGAAIVTSLDAGSPAEAAGVRKGWEIASAGTTEFAPMIRRLDRTYARSSLRELMLRAALLGRLRGPEGSDLAMTFEDGAGRRVTKLLTLAAAKGALTRFGFLAPMKVWIDARRLPDNVGYCGFNLFFDPEILMGKFAAAVESSLHCRGFVIDLRGNPGGIGAMAMGMAGWFLDKPGQRLGTLTLRDSTLDFVVNPRPVTFSGPLAILVDGASASTSEILAGGMRDLGRARIFGERTAAAALPSAIERLPNGDAFQYAFANYVSEGGRPLEGVGVRPDVPAPLTRAALLEGKDPALDAAAAWIGRQSKG